MKRTNNQCSEATHSGETTTKEGDNSKKLCVRPRKGCTRGVCTLLDVHLFNKKRGCDCWLTKEGQLSHSPKKDQRVITLTATIQEIISNG